MGQARYQRDGDPRTSGPGFGVTWHPDALALPLSWSKPRTVFVNSMSDLFHEDVPEEYIAAVVRVMVAANWHTYQVLTKRSERLRELLNTSLQFAAREKHIWWGVSVEDRKYGLPRVKDLQQKAQLGKDPGNVTAAADSGHASTERKTESTAGSAVYATCPHIQRA